MSTEPKILTDEQVDTLVLQRAGHNTQTLSRLCWDVEQAILQSPQVQQWKKDAGRYRYLRNGGGLNPPYFYVENEEECYLSLSDLDTAIDTAMEAKDE